MLNENDCWSKSIHNQIADYSSSMLWRFIKRNAFESEAEEVVQNLTGLNKNDIELLSSIRFLLSESVDVMINKIAIKIINQLSKESVNEKIVDRNRVCGRLDWQNTIKTRATAGNDPSIYVYTRRAQIFDLPENRLFLFLLRQIYGMALRFVSEDFQNQTWYTEEQVRQKWTEKVSIIAYKTGMLLKNPYILKISNLHEISDKIIENTYKHRQDHYRQLADISREYLESIKHPLNYLNKVLNKNILEPLNRDTLYEIAVLFKVLNKIISNGWTEQFTGLIGGSSNIISKLEKDNHIIKVYTQKLPKIMNERSAYGYIMSGYGITEKLRRPDIILEFQTDIKKHYLIIEVKRSKNRTYLADGSYKLLGYLMDYKDIKDDNTKLSGFLVGWEGINNLKYNPGKEVNLFNWNNLEDGINSFINEYEKS